MAARAAALECFLKHELVGQVHEPEYIIPGELKYLQTLAAASVVNKRLNATLKPMLVRRRGRPFNSMQFRVIVAQHKRLLGWLKVGDVITFAGTWAGVHIFQRRQTNVRVLRLTATTFDVATPLGPKKFTKKGLQYLRIGAQSEPPVHEMHISPSLRARLGL